MSCPTGHHTDSKVRRLFDSYGKNSRKSEPSTGRFPPTPSPMQRNKAAVPNQFGPNATENPNAPQSKRGMLNAGRRPIRSEAMPQTVEPMERPMNVTMVV